MADHGIRLGCPLKFLNMVTQLHEDQRSQVRISSTLSESFPITHGVKLGCVLAPTLFAIFFSMTFKQATEDLNNEDGIYTRYHLDGNLFNLKHLQAHTKTLDQPIRDLLFTNNAALVAHTERALQHLTSCFGEAAQVFGLEISLKKRSCTSLHFGRLKTVQLFTYVGCTISSDAKIDMEIGNSLAKANSTFGRLSKHVQYNTYLKKGTKIKLYRAVVLTTLLYSSESWVTIVITYDSFSVFTSSASAPHSVYTGVTLSPMLE